MKAFGTIVSGVVRDESGLPLSGATVYVVAGTGSWPDIAALTNKKGEYQLSGIDPGCYVLSVRHEDSVSATVEVEIREVPSRVDVTLRKQ